MHKCVVNLDDWEGTDYKRMNYNCHRFINLDWGENNGDIVLQRKQAQNSMLVNVHSQYDIFLIKLRVCIIL